MGFFFGSAEASLSLSELRLSNDSYGKSTHFSYFCRTVFVNFLHFSTLFYSSRAPEITPLPQSANTFSVPRNDKTPDS